MTMSNPPPEKSTAELADEFLRQVVVSYCADEPPGPDQWQIAERLLRDAPQIRDYSVHTAAATGDVARVAKWLDGEPQLLEKKGGPFGWEPLLYAAYARLPGVSSLAAGKILIERGADPNACFICNGRYRFTALTGVFGEGESGPARQPEHPEFEAFARVLLEAGADPNDSQAAYNRMFEPNDRCLELLIEYGLKPGDENNWRSCDAAGRPLPSPGETMHYQLVAALNRGRRERAKLLIDHGTDVNKPDDYYPNSGNRTPYHIAQLSGDSEIADYLLAHGAKKIEIPDVDLLRGIFMAGDKQRAQDMLNQRPALLGDMMKTHPNILHDAAAADHRAAVELLIDLGLDVNQVTVNTPLHTAAWNGHLDMVQLLIDQGADPAIRDPTHFAPPIGWAMHAGKTHIVDHLMTCDMDVFSAASLGHCEKLAEILDAEPWLLAANFADIRPAPEKHCDSDWLTPIAAAATNGRTEAVALLLERGADPNVADGNGRSLLDIAEAGGHDEIAKLLRAAIADEPE